MIAFHMAETEETNRTEDPAQHVSENDDKAVETSENPKEGNPENESSISENNSPDHQDVTEQIATVGVPEVESENTVGQQAKESIKELSENHVVTVELTAHSTSKESPEIVVEPIVLERHLNGRRIRQDLQFSGNKKFPVLEQQYHLNPPETINNSTTPPKSEKLLPVKHGCIHIVKYVTFYILFTAIIAGYAASGAILFSYLEKNREIEYNAKIDKWKNDTAILLATELRQVTPHEGLWARKVFQYLEIYEKDLLKASAIGYRRWDDDDREQRWTLTSSLLFSVSLMTTTGYGSMTPRSKLGRTATALYSLFGIPLAFCWFMTTGYSLAVGLTTVFRRVCCGLCREDSGLQKPGNGPSRPYSKVFPRLGKARSNSIAPLEEQKLIAQPSRLSHLQGTGKPRFAKFSADGNRQSTSEISQTAVCRSEYCAMTREFFEVNLCEVLNMPRTIDIAMTIVYSILFFVVYFTFCSIAFATREGWELLDIFYFNFLMFVTLGPGCHELEKDSSEIKLKSSPCYLMFLCLGYCILSMIVNLFYLLLRRKLCHNQHKQKWKAFQSGNQQFTSVGP